MNLILFSYNYKKNKKEKSMEKVTYTEKNMKVEENKPIGLLPFTSF